MRLDVVLVALAVRGDHVVQDQRQRREAGFPGPYRRHVLVAPGRIESRVVEEDVELVAGRGQPGLVRRTDRDARAPGERLDGLGQQLLQGAGDGGDRKRVTHLLSPRACRCSASVTIGRRSPSGRVLGAGAGTARTSTRPIVTWTVVGGDGSPAGPDSVWRAFRVRAVTGDGR